MHECMHGCMYVWMYIYICESHVIVSEGLPTPQFPHCARLRGSASTTSLSCCCVAVVKAPAPIGQAPVAMAAMAAMAPGTPIRVVAVGGSPQLLLHLFWEIAFHMYTQYKSV